MEKSYLDDYTVEDIRSEMDVFTKKGGMSMIEVSYSFKDETNHCYGDICIRDNGWLTYVAKSGIVDNVSIRMDLSYNLDYQLEELLSLIHEKIINFGAEVI